MYDPVETDISYEYLLMLEKKALGLRFAIIGGWGVFFQVKNEYQRAFGREYLKSRDIDIFIDAKNEKDFLRILRELGFEKSAYPFRYELIYDREEKKIISPEKAKQRPIFNLAYIFLDVFSNKKTKELGSWVFTDMDKAEIENIDGHPVLALNSLLKLKITSFFEREKLDKELKDGCDIFALLSYSGKMFKPGLLLKKAAEKIASRRDLQEYIAEQVLGDILKASLVNNMLRKYLGMKG